MARERLLGKGDGRAAAVEVNLRSDGKGQVRGGVGGGGGGAALLVSHGTSTLE